MRKLTHAFLYSYIFFMIVIFPGQAQTPINPPFSFPDVNIIQAGEKAYAFGGTDLFPYDFEKKSFIMPYWKVFSSEDLINWKLESIFKPENSYMGASDKCFAGHGVFKNNTWYWYFSNFINNTGVVVSDSPRGPWKDPLGKPLLPEDISSTREYDACIFTEENGQSYIIYGAHDKHKINYHIAALNEDMISLKEKPVKIPVNNIPDSGITLPVDAPFLHKKGDLYYLSWRSPYAVSKNIYGPYEFMEEQDAYGHLGFFTFNNQDFVNYTTLNQNMRRRYRYNSIAYVHYYDDGRIAAMEDLIHKHGVGQYQADWPAIQAEWYMKTPDGPVKIMLPDSGFAVGNLKNGDFLNYPNIYGVEYNARIEISYSCGNKTGGTLSARIFNERGPEYGKITFSPTGGWDIYKTLIITLEKNPPGKISLSFLVEGAENEELIRINQFRFLSTP